MDLIGQTIGNYQILEELGRGGMAVVYKAYQPSLNRYVAVKVLPPQLSFDREFVERFQREARAAAGLRHPNIVVIHDVGHEEGTYYLVMEYLEGRTLKQLIEEEGSLPGERVARIVEQIAAALDYAHGRGFVHRDVKPANIFVGEGDRVTLTDFGIAKAASETQHLTRTGMLMGTPEYMSPEQASGGRVDHRTDLYALGVVMYQMLVGRVPFRGTTPHATLHAVIYEAPPSPRQVNPRVTAAEETVVLKAVAKQPEQRYQRGSDMVAGLRAALAGRGVSGAVPVPPVQRARAEAAAVERRADRRRKQSPVVWIMAAIAVVLLFMMGGLLLLFSGDGKEQMPVPVTTEAVIWQTPTAEAPTPESLETAIAVATEAMAATEAAATQAMAPTWTAAVVTDTPPPVTETPLLPTETPMLPTETSGPPTEAPVSPTDTPLPTQPPAAQFGRLAFASSRDGNPEIYAVSLPGGNPVRLTKNNANDWIPDWSPNGNRIAFTSNRTGSYDLYAMNGDGGGQSSMVATGAWDEYARWAPDGKRLSFSSTATTQGVPNSEIFVRLSNGSLAQLTFSTTEDQWADWSPDGRIAFTEGYKGDPDWDILIMNGDGSNRVLWLGGPTTDVQPAWSPDGQWIAFLRIPKDTNGNGAVDFEDAGDVWLGKASGGGLQQLTSGLWASTPAWSPDGQWIAFAQLKDSNSNGRIDENDDSDIMAVRVVGGVIEPLLQGPHRDGNPTWTW